MKHARVLYHLVRADFLERARRYSFLLTLGFAVYLAYSAGIGGIVLRLDDYRGVLNSAWLGSMMTLVGTAFLSIVGFYIVKGAILRDQETRVGQILATTPMSRSFYTVAKALSNCAVLAAMMGVLAVAALILQVTRAEDPHIQLGTLLAPFVWVGLPAMAFTAAIPVLFETLPVLRGGVGNVIYFFVWGIIFGVSIDKKFDDVTGFSVLARNMQAVLKGIDPTYKNGISLTLSSNGPPANKVFLWTGVDWTPQIILHRLLWVAAAFGIALLAAVFFHRFDPAREILNWKRRTPAPANGGDNLQVASLPAASAGHLTPIARSQGEPRFAHLVGAELRLMLKGLRWWWYVVAAGLLIAELASPTAEARLDVLLAAWLWPILVWSPMGSRESRHATRSLVFSSPRALQRQLPALWAAGVLVAVLTGGGVAIRLALSSDWPALAAWATAALFVPSLALALGIWSGSSKFFEGLYTIWWYMGPLHHTPGLDFIGVTPQSTSTAWYLATAAALLAASYFGRRVRLGYA
jgi:hypothetical protein